MRPLIDCESGLARFQVSRRFYNLPVLKELAAEYSERAGVTFSADARHIVVSVQARGPVESEELWQLAGELANEWLNRQSRLLRSRRVRSEAALVVGRAFSSALGTMPVKEAA